MIIKILTLIQWAMRPIIIVGTLPFFPFLAYMILHPEIFNNPPKRTE